LKLNYINNINLLKSYKNIFEGDKKWN
jgi:hypothetical protein